ncbi:MAG: MobA/MobL family protein [Clostridia bacterium]|nr:MobA/MobL family protein [Clostridia bacterium]
MPAIYHCNIQIIGRSRGRSAVAAAAYRSGEKLTNNWDGLTHDYARKGGVIHSEIMLPSHAPPEFADRSTLWNAVEEIEKSCKAQLAREINIALPVELSREQQIELVREYCRDSFVSAGMCADFAVHDTGVGNPHAHIMLTMRPFREDRTWDDKQRKVYRLDENGQKIYDPVKRQYDCDSVPTTDWNEHSKAEDWRSAWADMTNKYLGQNGIQVRVDHRSYKRQGIEQIPTIHLGSAATQMERRGIRTEKGDTNRQIAADNKMIKELRARLSRLYAWSAEDDHGVDSEQDIRLDVVNRALTHSLSDSQYQKIKNIKNGWAIFEFIQEHQIQSLADLRQYIKDKNSEYYRIRSEIVGLERQIAPLNERIEMWERYQTYKPIRQKLKNLKPNKREKFSQEHRAELTLFESANNFFDELTASGEKINITSWRKEADRLTSEKNLLYKEMRAMQEEVKTMENFRKTVDQLEKELASEQDYGKETRKKGEIR